MPPVTNKVRLNCELAGEGEPLVLLHEIGGSLHSWDALTPLLSPPFRTVAYDQRGAGASEKIRGAFSLETQVDDLALLLDELSLQAVNLCGVAIGSALATRFAARFPDRVLTLVLACPALSVSADRKDYLAQRAAKVEAEGMSAAIDDTLAKSYPPQVQRDAAAYGAYRNRFLANDPASYAAINRAFAEFDATKDLSTVRCPVLVLAGEHDQLRPPAQARDIANRIRGARFAVIDSGHIMPVQAPNAMAAAMLAFYDVAKGRPENALFDRRITS